MRKRIYVSGPLTSSGNIRENLDAAMAAARRLIDAGYAPFTPHLSYHLDPSEELAHEVWMEVDLAWLPAADALLRLPGESIGADIEVNEARRLGIPVFTTIMELDAYFAVAQSAAA